MNAIVTLDSILNPSPAVVISPEAMFGTGQVETVLSAIETQVRAEAFEIETEEGREHVKSIAYKIARSKTTLDDMGKDHVAEIKKKSGAIDAERRTIRDRLDALKDEVRGPLTAWETAEADRVALHESALVFLIESTRFASPPSVATLRDRIQSVQAASDRDWQEFKERADIAIADAQAALGPMLAVAEQAEKDAEELAELRRLKAEREERDAAEATAKAAVEREAREMAAEAERDRIRAEQAEQEKAAAIARAVEQERLRAEQEKAAAIEAERKEAARRAAAEAAEKAATEAAERKRQENKKHRAKINGAIVEALISQLNFNETVAKEIVVAIASGNLPNVSITY